MITKEPKSPKIQSRIIEVKNRNIKYCEAREQ